MKHDGLLSGFVFYFAYYLSLLTDGANAFCYVSIALFLAYRFFSFWRVYQRPVRS